MIKNAKQKSGNHLKMFAGLYNKACSLEMFVPQKNGEILFKAMICGLSPDEKTINTEGKQLEPDKLPMFNIFLIFLKKYAEQSGYKLYCAYDMNVKEWIKCDVTAYNQAICKMQGLANAHYPELIDIGGNLNKLARDTIRTIKLIGKISKYAPKKMCYQCRDKLRSDAQKKYREMHKKDSTSRKTPNPQTIDI